MHQIKENISLENISKVKGNSGISVAISNESERRKNLMFNQICI